MRKQATRKQPKPEDSLLIDIKRLLVALLYKLDARQSEVAEALGIDESAVSRMLPKKKFTPIVKVGKK